MAVLGQASRSRVQQSLISRCDGETSATQGLCWGEAAEPQGPPRTLEPFLAFSALSWRCAVSRASPSSSVAVTSDVTTRCAVSVATYRKLRTTELRSRTHVWVMAGT